MTFQPIQYAAQLSLTVLLADVAAAAQGNV
jgi:hypothetical protein